MKYITWTLFPLVRMFLYFLLNSEGVYPQSDVSLAMIDIDASKGFVDLWVHLSFAILLF